MKIRTAHCTLFNRQNGTWVPIWEHLDNTGAIPQGRRSCFAGPRVPEIGLGNGSIRRFFKGKYAWI